MSRALDQIKTRRKFLRMLSASPLLASPNFLWGSFANLLVAGEVAERKFFGWLDSFQRLLGNSFVLCATAANPAK